MDSCFLIIPAALIRLLTPINVSAGFKLFFSLFFGNFFVNETHRHVLVASSPLRTNTVRNGRRYSLSQCDMNSLLANHQSHVHVSYDKSIYGHDDVDNYVIV